METAKSRIGWVDVAKFLGIFAIFWGHLGESVTMFGNFLGTFHVPIFFFLSGCMFTLTNENDSLKTLFKKKFKSLIIPYFYLCLLFTLVYGISAFTSLTQLFGFLGEILICVRGVLHAGSLWFLPCLFIMTMEFGIIKKVLKNKYLILLVCIGLYIIAEFIPYRPALHPKYFWGIDTALYYIIFFAFGAILFPWINKTLKNVSTKKDKLFLICSEIATSLYAILYFFGINLIEIFFYKLPGYNLINPVINSLILIWWVILISKFLENFSVLQKFGRDSLYLCGNEFLSETLVINLLNLFGIDLIKNLHNPLNGFIYVLVLVILCIYVLIPIEKEILNRLKSVCSLKN